MIHFPTDIYFHRVLAQIILTGSENFFNVIKFAFMPFFAMSKFLKKIINQHGYEKL